MPPPPREKDEDDKDEDDKDDDDKPDDDGEPVDDVDGELSYGVKCVRPTDGFCGDDCAACHWSWPVDDPDKCDSEKAACRCKPHKWTYIKNC